MKPDMDSPFHSFDLTVEETTRGFNLSPETRAVIQNYMAQSAQDLISASLEEMNQPIDNQRRAYIKGQIDTCKFFLQSASSLISTESEESSL